MGRTRRRRRNRDRGPSAEKVQKITQPLWNLPAYELMDEEKVALVHERTMQILEEGGIAFYDDEAIRILREHGVKVDDKSIAYFGREQVLEYLSHAPEQFEWKGRDPEKTLIVGGDHVIFSPVVGPPYVQDAERGRRVSTQQDLINFVKMAQMTPWIHQTGGETCVNTDIVAHQRHLDMLYAHMFYGDKPFMGQYGVPVHAKDSVAMMEILHGKEAVQENHYCHGIVNVSSPRRLDDRMLGAMTHFARNNQIIDVTPFILSGAMGPVSILGTVAQLNAEALAGIVYAQMVRKGTPCVYGSFQAIIDLQSGSPVFGAPESQLALYLSGQMARHYKLPFRAAGAYASSKIPDAQGAYESVMAMFPSMLVRPNFILHAAGWLENGLVADYEKFVLDSEMCGMYHRYLAGVSWDEDEWAMDSIINEVEPGGHHLGTKYTMERFRTAFYRAELFDYDSADTWQANGGLDTVQRATKKWKQLLNDYEQPPLDPAINEALLDYIARRRTELTPKDIE